MSNDDITRGSGPGETRGSGPGETRDDRPVEPASLDDRLDAAIETDPLALLPEAGGEPGSADAVGRGEGVGQAKEVEGLSQSQIVWSRFIRHRGAIFGIVTLVLIAALSYTAMGIGPISGWWRYQDHSVTSDIVNGAAPTLSWSGLGEHPFGQDDIGRDNFAMVLRGVQTSLLVMVVLGLISLALGTLVGSLAGYYRGRADTFLMRFTDLIITLPVIVLGAVLGKLVNTMPNNLGFTDEQTQAFRASMPLLLAVFLGLIMWPGLARLVRSEFLTLREREFVDAARVSGAGDWRIITKHMLPNSIGVIIVNTTLLMSSAVVLEAALSFLGFGITEPNVSLGKLISDYQAAFITRPWLFWWPGLFIILIALSVNFIGDGLRDAFDPRTRKIPSQRQMDKAAALLEKEMAK